MDGDALNCGLEENSWAGKEVTQETLCWGGQVPWCHRYCDLASVENPRISALDSHERP